MARMILQVNEKRDFEAFFTCCITMNSRKRSNTFRDKILVSSYLPLVINVLTIILSFAPNCTAVPHAISFHFRKYGERVALIVMKTNMPRKYVALYSDHIDRDCKDWMFFTCSRC